MVETAGKVENTFLVCGYCAKHKETRRDASIHRAGSSGYAVREDEDKGKSGFFEQHPRIPRPSDLLGLGVPWLVRALLDAASGALEGSDE